MKKIILFVLSLFLGLALYAQSADTVTEILDAPEVTVGQICYISASAQGFISDDASFEDAVRALSENGQISASAVAGDSATLSDIAAVYSKLFNVDGGLLYKVSNCSPRYAFKNMKAQGLIPASHDPSQKLSGREALSLFTKCNMKFGENPFTEEL
ncbi:MAG: hypothetical protein MJ181_00160 [Treponema sp.]|nr:hypothetical protein [Treponema sp.]